MRIVTFILCIFVYLSYLSIVEVLTEELPVKMSDHLGSMRLLLNTTTTPATEGSKCDKNCIILILAIIGFVLGLISLCIIISR